MNKTIRYSFLNNYSRMKQSEFFSQLTPNLKKQLVSLLTHDEKKRFQNIFTRYMGSNGERVINDGTIQKLLSCIELELLTGGNRNIVNKGDEFEYYYMIKQGSVK